MELYGNRHNEEYIFRRVSWTDWKELEEYPWITGGSVEMSANADLKTTGSFDFEGYELPDTSDLMRVYYSFVDDNGETGIYPIGTYIVSYNNITHTDTPKGIKSKGTLEASSVLKVLEDAKVGEPYVVQRLDNYIYRVQYIVKSFGLNIDCLPDSKMLATDHVFEAGTSYLEIVNWLCNQAGYVDVYPDVYGTIIIKPLDVLMAEHDPITLVNDNKSIIYPEIEKENEYQNTPNVVRLIYDVEDMCIIATARNVSGGRSSLDARGGREQTDFETMGDMPESDNMLAALMEEAKNRILVLSTDIEYVNYEHAYIPMQLYQGMTLKFGDMSWTGNIDNYTIELQPGTKVQTKLKRELPQDITVDVTGDIVRRVGGN